MKKELGENITSINKDDHLKIYKLVTNNVPEVTYCIDASCDSRVTLYIKIQCPYPNSSDREGTRSSLVSS